MQKWLLLFALLTSGCATHTTVTSSGWRAGSAAIAARSSKGKKKPVATEPAAVPAPERAEASTTPHDSPAPERLLEKPDEAKPLAAEPAKSIAADQRKPVVPEPQKPMVKTRPNEAHLIFDYPVTYNARVRKWIRYFQTSGRPVLRRWLERSTRFIPSIQNELKKANLPLDLAYVAMIESGFSTSAVSHANAMGIWQFIAPTGERYGLKTDWWLDERRDFEKATHSAIAYMKTLFDQFGSWYLVSASYNMGENGVRRLIKRHGTNSYWDLADRGALPDETGNYVPKMLAAMLISKAPALYGFRDLEFQLPYTFETVHVPGGTDLLNLASYLGVSDRTMTELNPELIRGFIPREVKSHRIRIPKGAKTAVSEFVRTITR